MKNINLPLAVSMGDPAGIGPEIAVKVISFSKNHIPIVIIGNFDLISKTARSLNIDKKVNKINTPEKWKSGLINVIDTDTPLPKTFKIGAPSAIGGKASYNYIIKAIKLAKEKKIRAVVTNPINKTSLKMANINYPGHTEIFADKTNTKNYTMLFKLDNTSVVHVTTHCSLKNAIDLVTKERVLQNINLLNNFLIKLGYKSPRIAVGGLNPHAGENGLFGTEEIDHIIPAIKIANHQGINVSGPHPPDTVFMNSFNGKFDGVVAMLHDHGFTALKSRDFDNGVNITVGLPIIRTSVGHGTAYDIVGKGIASGKSLVSAIDIAVKISS